MNFTVSCLQVNTCLENPAHGLTAARRRNAPTPPLPPASFGFESCGVAKSQFSKNAFSSCKASELNQLRGRRQGCLLPEREELVLACQENDCRDPSLKIPLRLKDLRAEVICVCLMTYVELILDPA